MSSQEIVRIRALEDVMRNWIYEKCPETKAAFSWMQRYIEYTKEYENDFPLKKDPEGFK